MWSSSAVLTMLLAYVLVRPVGHQSPEATTTYTTGEEQQATVTLNDGSQIMLAPRTTVRFARFRSHAQVDLDGEAYIKVTHAAGTPFLVRSNGVTVQVLGTEFLVRHYAGERDVHVAVADGKVRVQSRASLSGPVTLVAGRVANVSDSTIKALAIDERTADVDWVGGKLSFHNRPLPEVLTMLSRWYGYEFRVTDSVLARERVTLVLTTRSSTTVLALLEQLLSVNLSVVGDTVTLAPQSPHPSSGPSHLHNYDVWTPTREVGR
jgi:transmembrane sensor